MKLLLFDIDGTIIHAGGAGLRAANRADSLVFHIEDAMQGIKPAGKTDPLMLSEKFRNGLIRDYVDKEAARIY